MAHVLIGYLEALPAPEVIFSLHRAGHTVSAFARAAGMPAARLLDRPPHAIPEGAGAALQALQALMQGPDAPDLVLPLDDDGVWLTLAALGDDQRIAGARGPRAVAALDKAIQVEAAREAGLDVPPTVVARTPADLDRVTDFPAIAKPALAVQIRDDRPGRGEACYLTGPQDLDALRTRLAGGEETLLIQPLIAGRGEGIFGHATSDGVVAWSGHRRLRMMNPHGSGSSACISLVPDTDLRARVEAFLKALDWRGPFMVELLRDATGTPWFMELNGRMWGSLALARRQGLEYPAWAVAAAEDPAFRPEVPEPPAGPLVQRHLGREFLHLLFVLRGPKSDFHKEDWPGFWSSVAGVLRPARGRAFYNHDPAHPWYPLRDAAWTIRKALGR